MRHTISCYPYVEIAQNMREYAGIREDLRQALKYIGEVEQQMEIGRRELIVWEALTSAAAIAYGRCFKRSEARMRLPTDVHLAAPEAVRDTHDYVITVRDKHIAHSENAYEENRLVVRVEADGPRPQAVQDVAVEPHRLVAFGDPDVPKLRALFQWTLDRVDALYEEERGRTLEFVKGLPLEDVAAVRIEPMPAFLEEGAHAVTRKR